MYMSLKSIRNVMLMASLALSAPVFAKGDKKPESPRDPKKMEEFIAKLTEENTKTRLENLGTLKKAHHDLIDKIYKTKEEGAQELNKMWKEANLTDEKSKKEFFKKVREKLREFREKERNYHEEFRKNYLEKFDDEFKNRKKDRKSKFKRKFDQEKRERGIRTEDGQKDDEKED